MQWLFFFGLRVCIKFFLLVWQNFWFIEKVRVKWHVWIPRQEKRLTEEKNTRTYIVRSDKISWGNRAKYGSCNALRTINERCLSFGQNCRKLIGVWVMKPAIKISAENSTINFRRALNGEKWPGKKGKFFFCFYSETERKKAFNPVSIFDVFAVRLYRLFCWVFDVPVFSFPLSYGMVFVCMCAPMHPIGRYHKKHIHCARKKMFFPRNTLYMRTIFYLPSITNRQKTIYRQNTEKIRWKKNNNISKMRSVSVHGKKRQDKNACSEQKIKIGKSNTEK